jgi:hypothetical protein
VLVLLDQLLEGVAVMLRSWWLKLMEVVSD